MEELQQLVQFDTEKYLNIEVSNDLLDGLEEEGFTYLNCTYYASPKYVSDWWVNINKTSYLKGAASTDRLQLINAINIPYAPVRAYLKRKGDYLKFTLIFPALPKEWKVFEFIEVCGGDRDYLSAMSLETIQEFIR